MPSLDSLAQTGGQLLLFLVSPLYERHLDHGHHKPRVRRMADSLRRCQDHHGSLLDRLTQYCDILETGNETWRFESRA